MAEGEPKGGDADHPEPMTYEEAQTKGLTDKQFQVGLLRGWILPAGPDADLGAPKTEGLDPEAAAEIDEIEARALEVLNPPNFG